MGDEFHLTSTAFSDGGRIPRKHTGDGTGRQHDLSPPLHWHNVPEGTETLALVVEDIDAPDPEAPIAPFTHWVVSNIPASLKGLPGGFSSKDVPDGSELSELHEGVNDFKSPHYTGPNPPTGEHRYTFTLYALDSHIKLGNKVTKEKLQDAMEGHILAETTLTGHHGKEKKGAEEGNARFRDPAFKEQAL